MAKIKPVLDYEGKKNRRLGRWLASLNKEQRELLTEYCVSQSESDLVIQFQAYERVLRPALYTLADNDVIEAEKILAEIVRQVGIEGVALHNFKQGEWYMKKIDEIKENVIAEYNMRKANGEKDKDIIENIWAKYPKVSRNAVKNIILEHKRDEKKKELGINDINDAVKYIFDENEVKEEPKEMRKEEVKEDVVKSEEKSKFKVLKKTVIVDVAGEFGEYHVENGSVKAKDYVFNNEDEVKKEFDSRRQAILNQIGREETEILELMEMYK